MTRFTGRVIKGYQFQERVGSGAFGVVYRAQQITTGDQVAIKVILPTFANSPDFIRSFESEARLAARLEHESIVPLLDYWRDPAGAFLVMRYLPSNLSQSIEKAETGLPLAEIVAIFGRIGSALALAHWHGIIHCDIKPANILLDQHGNAYLSDFGIARVLNESETPEDSSAAEAFQGTLAYSSPEQFTGQALTTRTDIYGLGILLYEMLCGQRPFKGSTSKLIHSHVNEALPDVLALRPELPRSFQMIIQRATAKNPQSRYPHVSMMIAQLQALISGESSDDTQEVSPIIITDSDNPYKALRAFEEADSLHFFGRERLVDHMLEQLQHDHPYQHFMALVGPSGIGKTSLIQAGLIPALRKGLIQGSENWYIARMVPDPQPLRLLESLLLGIAGEHPAEEIDAMLASGPLGLAHCAEHILPEGAELLLIIDSFEQFYSLTMDDKERAHFIQLITSAARSPENRVRVLCVMRMEYLDQPMQTPGFSEMLQQRSILLGPLRPDELKEVIIGPARRLGLTVDRDLLAAMVADATDMRFALPLMQFALSQIFYQRHEGHLTLSAYVDVTGIKGALNRQAEQVFHSLDKAEQEAARRLFMRLICTDRERRDSIHWVKWSDIQTLGEDLPAVRDAFINNRLLLSEYHPLTHDLSLSITHDVLLHKWSRLRSWLDARHPVSAELQKHPSPRVIPMQSLIQFAAVFALMILGALALLTASVVSYRQADQDAGAVTRVANASILVPTTSPLPTMPALLIPRQSRSIAGDEESERLTRLAIAALADEDRDLAYALVIEALLLEAPSDYALALMADLLDLELEEAWALGPSALVKLAQTRFNTPELSCEQRTIYEVNPLCVPDKR